MAHTPGPQAPGGHSSVSALALAALAARRFYVDGLTKVEIARGLGISRFKVARLLSLAQTSGLVRIEVLLPASVDGELSEALRERFALNGAFVVVPGEETVPAQREAVARFTASLLEEVLAPEDVVGLAWGRTISIMASSTRAPLRCRFVQLSGALPRPDVRESGVDLVRRIAESTASSAATFYAPLAVADATTAAALRAQPGIVEALSELDRLTRAVVSIGAWMPGESTAYDSLDEADRARLVAEGVCAEVTGLLFDRAGRDLPALTDRVIGVRVDQLRRTNDVIAMAVGEARDAAAAAALRSGVVSTLVTHTSLARRLLELPAAS